MKCSGECPYGERHGFCDKECSKKFDINSTYKTIIGIGYSIHKIPGMIELYTFYRELVKIKV